MRISLASLADDFNLSTLNWAFVRDIARFGLVGGSGVVAFVVLSSIFVPMDLGLPVWVVSALCYAALILPVYLLHRRFSFRSQASHRRAFTRYVAVQALAVILATGLSYVAYHMLAIWPPLGSFLITGLTSALSFGLLRLWAFAHSAPLGDAVSQSV